MYTVIAMVDGEIRERRFDNMTDAIEFQERLVFEYGIDAEIQ